jgi:Phosphotransferase enzyme family
MTPTESIEAFCHRALGPCTPHPGPSEGTGHRSDIASVIDARGRRYIVKAHASVEKHQREVHAYTHWTAPALGRQAPRLIAVAQDLPGILLTAMPGEPADAQAPLHVHWQAGMLLRRFHDSQPPTPLLDYAEHLASRLYYWLANADGLLSTAEQRLIRWHVSAIADLPIPAGVPCHLDYQPRNWLIDHTGTVGIVDFEHARIDTAARDLVRLAHRHWPGHPDRRAAFLGGYGRQLTPIEQQLLTHCAALDAVTSIVRAHQTNDARLAEHGRATLRQLPPSP